MHFSEFQASLQSKKFHRNYFFCGSDSYLIEQAKKSLIGAIQEHIKGEIFISTMDLDETSVDGILSSAQSLPMFARRQMILVKGVEKLKENQAKKLAEYFKDPSPFTVLLFLAGEMDRKNKIFGILSSGTQLVDLSSLGQAEVKSWMVSRFRAAGFSIESDAARFLLETQGTDLGRLSSEIEKLMLYAGAEKRITLPMVTASSGFSRDHTVYELLNAILAKEKLKALKLVNEIMSDSSEALSMISLLTRQLRQLLQIRELSGKLGINELSKQVGLRNPFAVEKMMRQAKRFSTQSLALAISRLGMLDDRIKRSSVDSKVFMELLIHDLTR